MSWTGFTGDFCFAVEYPPEVLHAGKGVAADSLKKKMDEAALIIKTTYWWGLVSSSYTLEMGLKCGEQYLGAN